MNLYAACALCFNLLGILLKFTTGLQCDCTTQECMDQKTRICSGTWCYSETYDGFVETGCSDLRQPLLCENRLSSKLPQSRISHCCNDRDFCNKNVVPTPAPPRNIQDVHEVDKVESHDPKYDNALPNDILSNEFDDVKHDADHTDCPCAQNGPNKDNSRMLNPIYIAVPVAGVCVLLALVIFAMYLLRRRTDYYERYNYPRNVTSVPPCHVISGAKQNSSPCKMNRCTDSERSSASSETRLFL